MIQYLLQISLVLTFVVFCPAESLQAQMEPAAQWHLLYTQIRDGLISKQEAQFRLKSLEVVLKDLYLKHSNRKEKSSLCFPLEGYTRSAIGGKKGSGYQAQGYDFFDGDRHKGHPGHDIFIRDRDQDGIDDSTGKSVNVISASSGIIVSVNPDWEPSSPIRGGNYIWIYEPIKSRYYYYAHLNEILVKIGRIVSRGERIGTVGRTGKNAYPMRSPTHLHFAVCYSIEGCPMPVDPYRELVKGGSR
jgi:murein DD-endopeptidase MepM/ murein hydrolase activator NlpD